MTRFIVFEPPAPDGAVAPPHASDRAVLLRDAFAGWAVLFPFLWLFRHGLIVSGALVLVLSVGLGALAAVPGFAVAAVALPVLLGCLVALEGPSLRAARYRRRGWREVAVVDADDAEIAAILYYTGAAGEVPSGAGRGEAAPVARAPVRARLPAPRGASLLDLPRPR